MDPFTQRMLERAKARREKLEAKLPPSEQNKHKRQPLAESNQSPKPSKSPRTSSSTVDKVEKTYSFTNGSEIVCGNDENDVAVKINIVHQNNVQVEVQVEEREIPLSEYLKEKENDTGTYKINKISNEKENNDVLPITDSNKLTDSNDASKANIRDACKSRLQKLGKLYSDDGRLSSPIHKSKDLDLDLTPIKSNEQKSPKPAENSPKAEQPRIKKFGRLAALADQINNWEDDTSHHDFKKEKDNKNASNKSSAAKPTTTSNSNSNNSAKTTNPSMQFIKSTPKPVTVSKIEPKPNAPGLSKTCKVIPANSVTNNVFKKLDSPKKIESPKSVTNNVLKKLDSPKKIESPKKIGSPIGRKSTGPSTPVKKPQDKEVTKTFQPQVVGSSPKRPPSEWDRKILDNLERQGFSRATGMAACAPMKRPAPPPPPPPQPLAPQPFDESVVRQEECAPEPMKRDPAHMSVREKKAMFEQRRSKPDEPKRLIHANSRPKLEVVSIIAPVHAPSLQNGEVTNNNKLTMSEKDITDKVKKEREEDMKVIFRRYQKPDFDKIEQDNRDEEGSTEISPLMGNSAEKSSSTSLNAKKPAIFNTPKIIMPQPKDDITSVNDATDTIISEQPSKKQSVDSPLVVIALDDVKKIKVVPPRPGGLYPCLSDVEGQTSEEEKQSCPASLNTSSDSDANENQNEDWGNTSFGREVLQAVGVKKTPNSGKKATPKKTRSKNFDRKRTSNNSSDSSFNNENLDDLLDEAFDEEYEDGPTPPKQNKNGTQPSTSFCYRKGPEAERKSNEDLFKSPLKIPTNVKDLNKTNEAVKPLIHTVSFYRRSQQQGSQPVTPVKVIRVDSSNVEEENKQQDVQAAQIAAQEARRRVKELLEEVAKQNAIIAQASQALNLCASTIEFSGSTEQAEGERLLLLATHRRQACLHEVQRIQVEGVGAQKGSKYTLNIEEISLPLRRDYILQINADGAVGHYLECLVKCQERILATSLVKTTPNSNTVTFPDKFCFEGLDGDFKVTLEVYALQASKEILPHDIKYHIATKKSGKLATPRKGARGADLRSPLPVSSPGGPSAVRSPAMQPQGFCIFSYQQINRTSFTLTKNAGCSPLEGCLRVKLSCDRHVSQVVSTRVHRGFLTMFEEAGGFGAWHRRWCVLHSGDLSYWRYPDDEKKKTPMGSIELATAVSQTVGPAPRDICARQHTLLLETCSKSENNEDQSARSLIIADGRRRHLLAADTKPERDTWARVLNTTLAELRENA